MTDKNFADQAKKLQNKKVDLTVDFEKPASPEVASQVTLGSVGDTSGSITADAEQNPVVRSQMEIFHQYRTHNEERQAKESELQNQYTETVNKWDLEHKQLIDAAGKEVAIIKEQYTLAEIALNPLGMHVVPAEPDTNLVTSDSEVNLGLLQGLERESKTSRSDLERMVQQYSQWWFKRLVRTVIFLLILGIGFYLLVRASGSLIGLVANVYSSLRSLLLAIDTEWLGQALWYLAIGLSILGGAALVWIVGKRLYYRFFASAEKRDAAQKQIVRRRSDLVKLVFDTDENAMTRSFWGRMFVMSAYYLKHRNDSR